MAVLKIRDADGNIHEILAIRGKDGKDAVVDRNYNPKSENAQSGIAVEQAVNAIKTNSGTVVSQNADFAEVAEWADGNPNNEDRTGYFVCANVPIEGIVMKKAKSTDDVKGVTIETPAFAGNYSKDKLDENGNLLPQYSFVAVLGFVPVIDNGTCEVGGRCMPDDNGCAIPSSNSMGYQVVNRIDENRVLIIIEPNGDMVQRIKTKINDLQDKVNNISGADLSEYVKNTDYATSNKAGIVKAKVVEGFVIGEDGALRISGANLNEISKKESYYKPITPVRLDYAVKVGLTTNTETLTEEEKVAAQNWLGISEKLNINPDIVKYLKYVIVDNEVDIIGYKEGLPADIVIPDFIDGYPVTSIEDYAFAGCNSLTNVNIGNSVTRIGRDAFGDCESLTSITIPDSVTSIGECAFMYCSKLKNIYYTGTEADKANISIASSNDVLNSATWHYNYSFDALYNTIGDINSILATLVEGSAE